MEKRTIKIAEVKSLLAAGKLVKVKSLNGEYTNITNFIEKGILDTYRVSLVNTNSILVSANHMFFTDSGWVLTDKLRPNHHKILGDDEKYHLVDRIDYVGKERIVDITVDHPEECYFGNGMLNHNSGKSLLAAHALANTQKKGGLAVYIDTENAISRSFLEAIGVDLKTLLYIQMDNLEDIFTTVVMIVEKIRTSSRDRLVTFVLDSVMAASTKIELDADFDKDGYATQKAIILSKALRKLTNLIGRERILFIATNQLRVRMGITFGDKYSTSGGKALGFHSSVRLRTKTLSKIKAKVNGVEQVVGMKTRVVVQKNRIGPPHRVVDYEIYFDSGIDNYGGWLTEMKKYNIVDQGGAYYTYTHADPKTGEIIKEYKFKSKDFLQLLTDNPDVKSSMWNEICDKYISIYRPGIDGGIDDVIRETIDPFDQPDKSLKVDPKKVAKINVV